MIEHLRQQVSKVGLSPGTVVHTGEQKRSEAVINLLTYSAETFEEQFNLRPERVRGHLRTDRVSWIDIHGLHDVPLIEELGRSFGLHPLTLEDIANTSQRAKAEFYDDYAFIVLRLLHIEANEAAAKDEQISLVLGPDYVLCFHEHLGDVFEPLRKRLKHGGRARKLGADYLCYALIDLVVDSYFTVLEHYGDAVEILDETVFETPAPDTLRSIKKLKQQALHLRRAVWPTREVIGALEREESALVGAAVHTYLRDAHGHSVQVIETAETLRDLIADVQDTYLTALSFRLNDIMKLLTVIATLFIPLTFLVGVYGMNFRFMPELTWRWSYPALWLVMLSTVAGMLAYFRKERWL